MHWGVFRRDDRQRDKSGGNSFNQDISWSKNSSERPTDQLRQGGLSLDGFPRL